MLQVRASIGIALYPTHGSTLDSLMQSADIAMYSADRFDAGSDSVARDRLHMLSALRADMAGRRLTVHYQPQVDARTLELRVVELPSAGSALPAS